jgi:hypothetical protein
MKSFIKVIILLFFLVLVLATAAFPFIISFIIGNWWLLSLYAIIGIPMILEIILLMFILSLID